MGTNPNPNAMYSQPKNKIVVVTVLYSIDSVFGERFSPGKPTLLSNICCGSVYDIKELLDCAIFKTGTLIRAKKARTEKKLRFERLFPYPLNPCRY